MTSTLRRLLGLLRPSAPLVIGAVLAAGGERRRRRGLRLAHRAAAPGRPGLRADARRWASIHRRRRPAGCSPALLVLLALVKAGAQLLQTGWMQVAGQRALARLRSELYAHLLALPPAIHESRASGDVLSRLTADVAQVEFSVTQALTTWVRDVLQLAGAPRGLFRARLEALRPELRRLPRSAGPHRPLRPGGEAGRAHDPGQPRQPDRAGRRAAPRPPHRPGLRDGAAGPDPVRRRADPVPARRWTARSCSAARPAPPSSCWASPASPWPSAVGARAVRAEPTLASHVMSYVGAVLLMYGPLKTLSSHPHPGRGRAGRRRAGLRARGPRRAARPR